MRAIVQRVTSASVTVQETDAQVEVETDAGDGGLIAVTPPGRAPATAVTTGRIGVGLCVLIGVTHTDGPGNARRLAEKLWNLRLFPDEEGRMNRSAAELCLPLFVISQFTLYAETSRGRRPSFVAAAPADQAEPLVVEVVATLRTLGARVETGRFGVRMAVALINDGPLTFSLET